MQIKLFVDGSCLRNPGVGGWVAVIIFPGYQEIISGCYGGSTNNEMELVALLEGVRKIYTLIDFDEDSTIEVYSDSSYIVCGFWSWVFDGGGANLKVCHFKLWKDLALLVNCCLIKVIWISAHSGVLENCIADSLAKLEAYGMCTI